MAMIIYLFFLSTVVTVYGIFNSTKNYGSFNVSMTKFEICKGPKLNECSHNKVVLNNHYSLHYELEVLQNVTPNKGKVVAITNGKEFLRLQLKKPCDHLFFRPLLASLMNITEECVILKGKYTFNVNVQEIAKRYFGGTFVYGDWKFKTVIYSNTCNFHCSITQIKYYPI